MILVQNKYFLFNPVIYNSIKHINSNSVNVYVLFKILTLGADT